MNPEVLVPFLLEFLAKSALILAAAVLINGAWVRASAAQRHLVWCAALATVLLLPLTRLHKPRWTVPLQRVTVELSRQPRTNLPPIESVAAATTALPAAPRWRWPDWKQVIIVVWSAGVGLLFAARLLGSVRLAWLRKTTHPLVDARTQRMAAGIFTELGIRRTVELRLSSAGCVPLTWGSLRPVLTLPGEALAWNDARLAAALRHEAGHIARGDHFTRTLAHLACIFYWPNPLVWLAARQLRAAQEEATDDLVLRGGATPEEYAAQLFDVARTLVVRRNLDACAVAMASPSTLERRILAIVDDRRDRRPLTLRAITGGVLAVAVTLGIATVAQVQAQKESAAPIRSAERDEPVHTGELPRAKGPQVEIETKFIELSGDRAGLPDFFKEPDPKAKDALRAILSDEQMQVAVRTLTQRKGVDLLAAPRVTTFSKQDAKIEIVREFRYATEWDKDPGTGAWKGKTFTTKNLGVTFDVTPEVNANGSISLHMVPEVVEFEGFRNLDAKPDAAKLFAGAEGVDRLRTRPVFSSRKIDISVTAKSGDTIVLSGPDRVDIQTVEDTVPILGEIPFVGRLFKSTVQNRIKRGLIVLVTARIIAAGGSAAEKLAGPGSAPANPPGKPGAARSAPGSIEITSESFTHDTKTGTVKATGDVTIKTPEATIRTPAAEIQPKAPAPDPLGKVILPRIEFHEAKLSEVVDFLIAKGRQSGAASLNIIVVKPPTSEPTITLTLTEIPLTEAIRYVADLAGLKVRRDASAFVFEPAAP